MPLALRDAFTAPAIAAYWDNYQRSLGEPPYLGRSFFGTQKKIGLDLRFIYGSHGLPVSLKASNFGAQAPLRDAIGFHDIQNSMPFFRESYMVTEKEEQDYMVYESAQNEALAAQVLGEIMKSPMELIRGANVVPERMIWQLLAPTDGVPKIRVYIDGQSYVIDYTDDDGAEYKSKHYMTTGTAWADSANATPLKDIAVIKEAFGESTGKALTTLIMNQSTWKQLVNAEDTHKQVQGVLAYNAGLYLNDPAVKNYLLENYGITVLVYDKRYQTETGANAKFIPDGVISALADGVGQGGGTLGTVYYGTTPEERSGANGSGKLQIVETGVTLYTYTTDHPINTHCVCSEIVLPSFEGMNNTAVINVQTNG